MSTPKKTSKKTQLAKAVRSVNIAKTMNECLWVGDKNHKTVYVNPLFEKLSECSLNECIGKDCDTWFDEEGKKTITAHHGIRQKGKSSQYEANMISKSGKVIPLLISGAPTKTGGTIGIFTNLTQLKKLEKQGKVAQQVIKNSTEAIVILSKTGKIKMWNKGATSIFGYEEEEVLNKSITLLAPQGEEHEIKENLKNASKKNHLRNIETLRRAKDGSLVNVTISITKVTEHKKKFIGFLTIYRNITERIKINTELQKRFETIQDAYKELGLQKRQADYLHEICATASSKSSIETLSNLIISAISLLTRCDGAVLRIYDEKSKNLNLKACIGVSQQWLSKNKIPLQTSLADKARKNKRPIIIDNIQNSPTHKGVKLLKSHKFSTMVLLPLILGDIFIGTISLYTNDPSKFRFIETDFLENMSRQCALALFFKIHSS